MDKLNKDYQYGFSDDIKYQTKFKKGISYDIVREISLIKKEPLWMQQMRLDAFSFFEKHKQPNWGPDLNFINFNDYIYYVSLANKVATNWNDVPEKVKNTFAKLGIPEAEAKYLNGVTTQYDSTPVYHSQLKELDEKGVIFCDTDTALSKYPELFKKYFGTLVNSNEHKYAALNAAVWSGGTFIYIPKNTHLTKPLQSYFRINSQQAGQFERTLIIVDDNSSLHYVEGCTAPVYKKDNLHCATVEVFVGNNSKCQYTTIQNWSDNVLNLVTKRAIVKNNGSMHWIDGNVGSRINMKYPSTILKGDNSAAESISIAVANNQVIQDTGVKVIHLGKNTRSKVVSKSISSNKGQSIYRGLVFIGPDAINANSEISCDSLLLDNYSQVQAIPTEKVFNNQSTIKHEAKISDVDKECLYYLMARGLPEDKAKHLLVMGFLEEFTKRLPMEFAVELNRLIDIDMSEGII